MNSLKKNEREDKITMRINFLLALFMPLLTFCRAQADTVWESGHHEIFDGDVYGEIYMYNDCTLDIFGGDIYRLSAHDTTVTDWYDGLMDALWTFENSIVNIYGGELDRLSSDENSLVNLYAYDVTHLTTGGFYDYGQVMGKYYSDNTAFCFDLCSQETYSHINIVPEPATFLFLALGVLGIRRRRN